MARDVERFNRWARSYDRDRLQRLVFEPVQRTVLDVAAAQVPRPTAILDVGCGTGRLLRLAEDRFPEARLEGVDAAEEMIKQAQAAAPAESRIHFRQATAERLPFGDAEFDLAFSTMTFHHWSDQPRGIAEMARVLKPAGRWLVADFIPAGFMRYIRRLLRMSRFRERQELERMLAAAGMELVARRVVPGLGGQVSVIAAGRIA